MDRVGWGLGRIVVVVVLATVGAAHGGREVWTCAGPEGGETVALAIAPGNAQVLYAARNTGGPFRSTDGGRSWEAHDQGLAGITTRTLVVSPADPWTVYLGTHSAGVQKSTDGGVSWSTASDGLTDLFVTCLAISSGDPATLFAGTYTAGVFKSVDGGRHWSSAGAGLPAATVNALVTCRTDSLTLYVGTRLGVWKSTDGARSWSEANSGLTTLNTRGLAVSSTDAQQVYAAAYSGGVFRSTDGGGTWTAASSGLTATYTNGVTLAAAAPTTLYARTSANGLFRSTDSGQSWTLVSAGLDGGTLFGIDISPTAPQTVYAATSRGVFVSTDAGDTWTASNSGLKNTTVYQLAESASSTSTLFAAGYTAGVFRSVDGGDHWQAVINGLGAASVRTVLVAPSVPEAVYAGTMGGQVYRSTDAGDSWTLASNGLTATQVTSLVRAAGDPQTLYAGTSGNGVYRSTDGGSSWTSASAGLPSDFVSALAAWPTGTDTLLAGSGNYVARTVNGGATWEWNSSGLPALAYIALAVAPTVPRTLYAGCFNGVFKSVDGGLTWGAANTGLTMTWVQALAVSPDDPRVLLVGTWGGGVFRSADGGSSWAPLNTGLTNLYALSVLIPSAVPGTVYTGTGRGGVFALTANRPPTAVAGPDLEVAASAPVSLNGSGSTDADGDSLHYHWSAPAAVCLSDSTAPAPTFVAPATAGCYPLLLTVGDGYALSAPDTLRVTVTDPRSGWAGDLVARTTTGAERTLRFGWYGGADAGLNPSLGEFELPPTPQGNSFDVRWAATPPLSGLAHDYRSLSTAADGGTWSLWVQAEALDLPVTLTWDPVAWPLTGAFRLVSSTSGSPLGLDMRAHTGYEISVAGPSLVQVQYQTTEPVDCTYDLPARWNLVSLPMWRPDTTLAGVLPAARSLFGFSSVYAAADRFVAGMGYWVSVDEPAVSSVSGWAYPDAALQRSLPAHWSLVGPGHRPIEVSALRRACPQLVSVYGYAGGYHPATALMPGHAYWVNLSAPAVLDLTGTVVSGRLAAGGDPTSPVTAVEVNLAWSAPDRALPGTELAAAGAGAAGAVGESAWPDAPVLWVDGVEGAAAIALGVRPEEVIEMPPLPPPALFDVRVDVGDGVAALQVPAVDGLYPVRLQGHVTGLRWRLPADSPWQVEIGPRLVALAGTGHVGVDEGSVVRLRYQSLPTATALTGAYPNPFNPSVTISYELARFNPVSLRLYAVTGQLVRELVSDSQPAGHYCLTWDGRDARGAPVGAGVYLAQLRAGSYSGVVRLLLLK